MIKAIIFFLLSFNLYASGPFTFQAAESVPFDNETNGFIADDTQAAIEEIADLADSAIFTITLLFNGTLSGTKFVSYSNLTPNTDVVIPINCKFTGFTYSNRQPGADYTINFRKNTNGGAAFYSTSKNNTKFFTDTLPVPEIFNAGDIISTQYVDNGGNSNDGVWLLNFKALP